MIVQALGLLKVKAALPRLTELYVDARNDERRGRQSGFRFQQSMAQMESQFATFSRLDALAADFDELSRLAQPRPVSPRDEETLLEPATIMAAVSMIGPDLAQVFYRTLAGETDYDARQEAAQMLALGIGADLERNLPVLRSLMADHYYRVSMKAAVSLVLLGDETPRKQIIHWLDTAKYQEGDAIITELARVKNGKALAFSREALVRRASREEENRDGSERVRQLLKRIP